MNFRFTGLIVLFSFSLFGQTDLSKIDEYAKKVPFEQSRTVEDIVAYLTKNADTDLEKTRAIYVWITKNVKYDYPSIKRGIKADEAWAKKQSPRTVLRSKKAVCQGYSNLFKAMADEAGLEAIFVGGKSKHPSGKVNRIGHAWNAVKVDGKWQLIDATWGAGMLDENGKFIRRSNEQFFLTPPEKFVLEHYPSDPLFQLLSNPISLDEFKQEKTTLAQTVVQKQKNPRSEYQNAATELSSFAKLTDKHERNCASSERTLRDDPNSSFGNYQRGYCLYKLMQRDYEVMNNEATKASQSQTITKDKVRKWKSTISTIQSMATEAKTHLGKVQDNAPEGRNARGITRSIRDFEGFLKKQGKQFDEILRR